jgi:predicted metal-dependent hydrolase
MSTETIRVFAISKLAWIRREQKKLRTQDRESPREFLDRESHYVWGKRYLLRIVNRQGTPMVTLKHSALELRIAANAGTVQRHSVLESWYRDQVKAEAPALVAKWSARLAVPAANVFVRKMKTKWGSCSPARGTIRLNTGLARLKPQCLDYVVVHELSHLLERKHNERFIALLDRHLPQWRALRDELTALPLSHQKWMR